MSKKRTRCPFTTEQKAEILRRHMVDKVPVSKWQNGRPSHFQILLRVTVLDHENVGGVFTVEDVWPSDDDRPVSAG